jgi:hypothetical protein
MLKILTEKVRRARHKLARAVLGLSLAERRIDHHAHQLHHYEKTRERDAANRARRLLHKWQKRQTKLRDRHVFLQGLLDKRLRAKHLYLKTHPPVTQIRPGVVEFDGKPCAEWIATILAAARAAGTWGGYLLSGVRTSAESVGLCIAMCGASSCPGRCGGTASNHNCDECGDGDGAADVTDPAGLQRYCREHGIALRGNGEVLPADVNHFSRAGN